MLARNAKGFRSLRPGKVRCSCGCTSRKSSVYLLAGSPFPPPFQKDHTRVNSREIRPPAHPRRITRESTRGRSANPPISERLTCGRSANPPVSERSSASKLAGDLQEGEGTNCPRVSIHHPFVTYSHNHSALYEPLPGESKRNIRQGFALGRRPIWKYSEHRSTGLKGF